ncbi:MAG: M23 family metallopeptidase [Bacteroidia bacterium]
MIRCLRLVCFACFATLLSAQEKYVWPIDFINISGNYGEIRPNHFHAGIDFSTQKEENFPVFAADNGYVSRIKISPYGYGKALYVTHPNGTVSVYGHQNKFNLKLAAYVKEQQYAKQSFEIELFLKPDQFPVKKGELIGYSGNTGGSTGPHLHFEIRDEKTEVPLNPLLYYKYLDTVKPIVNTVYFYDLSDPLNPKYISSSKVKRKRDGSYGLSDSAALPFSVVGIAFSGDDIDKPDGNPNNIYDVKLKLDTGFIYHHQLNNISFDNARYVNIYAEVINGRKVQKCFTPKLYPEAMYKKLVSHGVISLKDTLGHTVQMTFTDESGNSSLLNFRIKASAIKTGPVYNKTDLYVDCEKDYAYHSSHFSIQLPAKTLFNDAELKFKNETATSVLIESTKTEFRSPGLISVQLSEKWQPYAARVLLFCKGAMSVPVKSGAVNEYNFKSFGDVQLKIDTTGPRIKTRTPAPKLKTLIRKAEQLSFVIEDNLSGIGSYAVFVNGKWVLAEYDAKADTLTYYFDDNTVRGTMDVRVEVKDRVGNSSIYALQLNR